MNPRARVDLAAVTANTARLRAAAGGTPLMAVVKADAYGHGLLPCARAAVAGGAGWLGVALLSEALQLRAAGIAEPILAWLLPPGSDLDAAVAADIDLSVAAEWGLAEVVAAAARQGRTARIHLKADTGLGRGGCPPGAWDALAGAAAAAERSGTVRVVGVWSHLAYADSPHHPTIDAQLEQFGTAVAAAGAAGLQPEVRHLANSAATLTRPDTWFDLVRPGIAIYGVSPGPEVGTPGALGLRPAMTLSAPVALVKRVPAGHGVSYAHAYVTERETTLALIPLGYADGIPRHASGAGPVVINGDRFTVAGRVCMDQFVVDVGDAEVAVGDEAVLLGAVAPTVEDWAIAADTIGYEIVTRVGPRVPREYVGGAP